MEPKLPSGQFYGQISRSCKVAAITLTETMHSPGRTLPSHSHEQAYFCFVLGGRFTELCGPRPRACMPATLIFHPIGELHSDHFQTEVRCFNLQLDPSLNQHVPRLEQPATFHGGMPGFLATRLYREFREMDDSSALAIEGLTLELLAVTARSKIGLGRRAPPWLERVRELLHARFAERLSLADLAAEVAVHPTHLARQFHRCYHQTIGEYVRHLRIDFARTQLRTSTAPLSEIAIAAGFFDQSHFTRTFKLYNGMSPHTYRKIFRNL
jgi:AraC family transcriptional regulator